MPFVYSNSTLSDYCDLLADKDHRIKQILDTFGYPPFWERRTDFEGLVRIILEQQVSLASALAVYKKLKDRVGPITPERLMPLSDETFKSCGFSRQKTRYVRILAEEVQFNGLNLEHLQTEKEITIRDRLIRITGIGQWTCDIYLLLCLNRLDIFPTGDLALVKSMVENHFFDQPPAKEEILALTQAFKPYRSIFAILLWHSYIIRHKINISQ